MIHLFSFYVFSRPWMMKQSWHICSTCYSVIVSRGSAFHVSKHNMHGRPKHFLYLEKYFWGPSSLFKLQNSTSIIEAAPTDTNIKFLLAHYTNLNTNWTKLLIFPGITDMKMQNNAHNWKKEKKKKLVSIFLFQFCKLLYVKPNFIFLNIYFTHERIQISRSGLMRDWKKWKRSWVCGLLPTVCGWGLY